MASATVNFGAVVTGLLSGTKIVAPPQVLLSTPTAKIVDTNDANAALLQAGDNTVTVPTGSTWAVIAFPTTMGTVKWKGAGGDTGTQMIAAPIQPLFAVMLVAGLANFILNASIAIPNVEVNFL
jgi:hypothetical protein